MQFLKRLFQKAPPVTIEPWLPRTALSPIPGLQQRARAQKEYRRKIHWASAYWKHHSRNSFEHNLSRAEARLVQWTYEAFRCGHSEEFLAARVACHRPGWPYFSVKLWQDGARFLLRRFRGEQ